jgi:hypothetical protein
LLALDPRFLSVFVPPNLEKKDDGFYGKGIYFTTYMLYALPYFRYKRNFSRGRIKARGGEREGWKLERREKEEVGRG